ncbi:MAG TPA: hypothetical protein VFH53_07540 [Phycisphaerae bacterium]|nr:hypothetical protein [Phycisphaerae bacterium]
MTRRRHLTLIALLGIVGLLGVAVVAVAQLSMQAARMQYDKRNAELDRNNPDAIFELAKWAYQNDLKDEALKLAIEANAKAPDDVRPKFLVWAVAGVNLTGEETAGAVTPAVPPITADEVQAVFKREGAGPMNGFRRVQSALISSCARTGCHIAGNPDAPFTLIHTGTSTDKTLVQNFLTINKYLDREKPDESRLLLKPFTGENNHPKKFSAKKDPLFKSISAWIDTLKTQGEFLWGEKAAEKSPLPAPSTQ